MLNKKLMAVGAGIGTLLTVGGAVASEKIHEITQEELDEVQCAVSSRDANRDMILVQGIKNGSAEITHKEDGGFQVYLRLNRPSAGYVSEKTCTDADTNDNKSVSEREADLMLNALVKADLLKQNPDVFSRQGTCIYEKFAEETLYGLAWGVLQAYKRSGSQEIPTIPEIIENTCNILNKQGYGRDNILTNMETESYLDQSVTDFSIDRARDWNKRRNSDYNRMPNPKEAASARPVTYRPQNR
jgi:hypothetical protein